MNPAQLANQINSHVLVLEEAVQRASISSLDKESPSRENAEAAEFRLPFKELKLPPADDAKMRIKNSESQATTTVPANESPEMVAQKPNACIKEQNEFYSYFQEMNEKAHDQFQQSQPEPERALEFLKKAEDFLNKIE